MQVKSVNTGYTLVQIDDSNEWIKLGNGKLWIDTTFEPEKHSQTKGIVIKNCEADVFSVDTVGDHYSHCTYDNEVKVGDAVIFHFLCVQDAINHGRYFVEDGKKLIFIRYDELYVILRSDKIIPINGWLLVEPKEVALPKTKLHVPDMVKGRRSMTEGIVKYASSQVNYYDHDKKVGTDPDIQAGDEVRFRDVDAIPIQYELHAELGLLYRMRRKDCYKVNSVTLQVA